jgi:hypothetical protein
MRMPRPLVHCLASLLILAAAGFLCGAFLWVLLGPWNFRQFAYNAMSGAFYCWLTHGIEVVVATIIYYWLFHRRKPTS